MWHRVGSFQQCVGCGTKKKHSSRVLNCGNKFGHSRHLLNAAPGGIIPVTGGCYKLKNFCNNYCNIYSFQIKPMLTITFHSRVLPAYLCVFVGTRRTFSVLGNQELCQHTFSVLGNQELCLFSCVSPHSSLSLCVCWDSSHVFCPREPRTVPLLLGFVSCEKPDVSQGVLWGLLTLAALALLPRLNQPRPRTSVGRQEVTSLVVALTPPRLCPPSPFVSPEALGCLMQTG